MTTTTHYRIEAKTGTGRPNANAHGYYGDAQDAASECNRRIGDSGYSGELRAVEHELESVSEDLRAELQIVSYECDDDGEVEGSQKVVG